MISTRRTRWMVSAAAATVGVGVLTSAGAMAQQRVGSDGRALDANNRIGSGGLNSGTGAVPNRLLNNQLVTGDVTGGKQFRGFVPYTDPTAFRGNTAGGNMDSFVRQSAGVPRGGFANNNAGNFTSFYGDSRGVAPPPGTRQQGFGTPGAVPAPLVSRAPGDLRLGQISNAPLVQAPAPGQLFLPGPVDPTSGPSLITASPLYGVRQWSFGSEDDQQSLDNVSGSAFAGQRRSARLESTTLDRMRNELNNQPGDDGTLPSNDAVDTRGGADLNRPLDRPFDAVTPEMQNKPVDSTAAGAGAVPGIVAPKVEPLPGVSEALPKPTDTGKPRPPRIDSLARDMKPSATTDLMKEAEQLMREGRFTTALERYDQVDQVTPDDPLATLGRATAELGASYYTRADSDLRKAFTKHPALLMGQYDLRVFLGEDRLQYLIKDLKDVANKDQAQARPVFLLAYIYYNLGDERRAAGYLDLASKRSGGNDPVIKLVKQHWTLPEEAPATPELPMNK